MRARVVARVRLRREHEAEALERAHEPRRSRAVRLEVDLVREARSRATPRARAPRRPPERGRHRAPGAPARRPRGTPPPANAFAAGPLEEAVARDRAGVAVVLAEARDQVGPKSGVRSLPKRSQSQWTVPLARSATSAPPAAPAAKASGSRATASAEPAASRAKRPANAATDAASPGRSNATARAPLRPSVSGRRLGDARYLHTRPGRSTRAGSSDPTTAAMEPPGSGSPAASRSACGSPTACRASRARRWRSPSPSTSRSSTPT